MISIVIPAHNEGAVVERCLRAMTAHASPGEFEVIVVCNGCSDDTAARARAFGADVRVLETDVASKSHALNLGDEAATGFPRFYVDADVILSSASIRRVAEVLEEGPVLAAAPRLEVDLRDRAWPMRAYHEIWMRLPYVQEKMLGSGVYALSRKGRERFTRFPDIIADDEFIRRRFAPSEKVSVSDASFTFIPPATLANLVHIEIRRRRGMEELEALQPEDRGEEYWTQRLALAGLLRDVRMWPAIAVYVWVKIATRLSYAWQRHRGHHTEWRRDESSRVREPSEPASRR